MKTSVIPVGNLETNCYFLTEEQTGKTCIIDPGYDSEKIIKKINDENLKVEFIIITHAHFDHICALDKIKEYTNAKVIISDEEAKNLSNPNYTMVNMVNLPSQKTIPDIKVNEEDEIPFCSSKLKFIMTPGHTKGSMCILIDKILFSGDTLFFLSMGRTDFSSGNMDDMLKSLSKLIKLDDDITVYPGHGDKTNIGFEKQNNPYCNSYTEE